MVFWIRAGGPSLSRRTQSTSDFLASASGHLIQFELFIAANRDALSISIYVSINHKNKFWYLESENFSQIIREWQNHNQEEQY